MAGEGGVKYFSFSR